MEEPRFDVEDAFDDDYLYFYYHLTPELSDEQADLIWRLLELEPGMEVLDLACGHGRIANRLASRGARVTGLDRTPRFLERARADAGERGVEVEYVEGDMREIPWEGRFDRVVNWFTAYGYFEDDGNREVLRQVQAALKPGGRFLVDLNHRDWLMRNMKDNVVVEREGDFMIDFPRFHVPSGQMRTERVIVRGGTARRFNFFIRMFSFTELRGWLEDAGFEGIEAFGEDGEPLTIEHARMAVVSRRP